MAIFADSNRSEKRNNMSVKKILLPLLVALMSTATCLAQEGMTTVDGVPVVEEIVSDSSVTESGNVSNAYVTTKVGTWSVTCTNDSVDTEALEEFLNETFDEGFAKGLSGLLGGMMGLTAVGGLLIVGIVLFCIFGLPLLFIALIIWLIVRNSRRNVEAAKSERREQDVLKECNADRTKFNKGIKNVCLGVGLAIFLGLWIGDLGVGIGALIVCVGVGELLIDYFAKK